MSKDWTAFLCFVHVWSMWVVTCELMGRAYMVGLASLVRDIAGVRCWAGKTTIEHAARCTTYASPDGGNDAYMIQQSPARSVHKV